MILSPSREENILGFIELYYFLLKVMVKLESETFGSKIYLFSTRSNS